MKVILDVESKVTGVAKQSGPSECQAKITSLNRTGVPISALPTMGSFKLGPNDNQPHIMVGLRGGVK